MSCTPGGCGVGGRVIGGLPTLVPLPAGFMHTSLVLPCVALEQNSVHSAFLHEPCLPCHSSTPCLLPQAPLRHPQPQAVFLHLCHAARQRVSAFVCAPGVPPMPPDSKLAFEGMLAGCSLQRSAQLQSPYLCTWCAWPPSPSFLAWLFPLFPPLTLLFLPLPSPPHTAASSFE